MSKAHLARLMASAACAALSACASLPELAPEPAPAPAAAPAAAPDSVRPTSNVGQIEVVQWPVVRIDRKEFRAAPGARIINTNNLTMTANQLPPNTRVSYELDGMGQIRTIRVLPANGDAAGAPGMPRTGPQ